MWRRMFSRNSVEHRISVNNGKYLPRFQELCERYGFVPTYLVNYEMSHAEPLIAMGRRGIPQGKLEIGMHMHAWSCPPFYEFPPERQGGNENPYIGEYPTEIIEQKVEVLVHRLKEAFQTDAITSHRSGRWQMEGRYAEILHRHGFLADCSVTPGVDWSDQVGQTRGSGGSDYRGYPTQAYEMDFAKIERAGKSGFYEVPVTIAHQAGKDPVWLRPSGRNLSAMLDLVQKKTEEKVPYLEFMIHSTELMPFGSPNFPTEYAIEKLYQDMETLFTHIAEQGYHGIGLSGYVRKKYGGA